MSGGRLDLLDIFFLVIRHLHCHHRPRWHRNEVYESMTRSEQCVAYRISLSPSTSLTLRHWHQHRHRAEAASASSSGKAVVYLAPVIIIITFSAKVGIVFSASSSLIETHRQSCVGSSRSTLSFLPAARLHLTSDLA